MWLQQEARRQREQWIGGNATRPEELMECYYRSSVWVGAAVRVWRESSVKVRRSYVRRSDEGVWQD